MEAKTRSTKFLTVLAAVIVLVLVVTSISAVVAYMIKKSDDVKNTFVPANIDFYVAETFDGEVKSSVKIQNKSNIEAYLRVRVVTYWEDSKGNVVARGKAPEIKFGSAWTYNSTYWIYDKAEYTFYYKSSVLSGDTTSELLGTSIEMHAETVTLNGIDFTYHPVIEFVVEGIQANPKNAVTESWGVTLDSDGKITNP